MAAIQGRDAVHTAFLASSRDGDAISTPAEWRHFIGQLKAAGVCSTSREVKVLEEAWARCDTAQTSRRLTFAAFRNHVVSAFLRRDPQSEDARAHVRRVRGAAAQLQALGACGGAPLNRCREVLEKCDEAGDALGFGEAVLARSLAAAERALERERLAALVRGGGGRADAAPDPAGWHVDHAVDVEKRCAGWRASSRDHLRFPKGGGRLTRDDWGLCGTPGLNGDVPRDMELRLARVLGADGVTRDAFVVAILSPERGAAAVGARRHATRRRRAWAVYAALRDLSCVACAPRAYGWVEDHPGDGERRQAGADEPRPTSTLLVYERPRGAAPLASELARLKRAKHRVPLTATAPLVRHWLREALARFAEVDGLCRRDLDDGDGSRPLGARHLWIGEHGAALRLASARWGDELEPLPSGRDAVLDRSRRLLAAFADAADAIVDGLCGGNGAYKPGDAPRKVYNERDALAGVHVCPGERFDVLLDPPKKGHAHAWRCPDLGESARDCVDVLDGCDDPGAPLPRDGARARLRCVAKRAGAVALAVVAVSRDGHRSDALTISVTVGDNALPGELAAILAVCRDARGSRDGAPAAVPCAPRALLAHDFFRPLTKDDLVDAMDSYNRLFLADDSDDENGPGDGAAPLPFPGDAAAAAAGRRLQEDR